ncbi:hypothetical protein Ssi02_74940 [Sinosporangium siamense]|uniref:Transposase Helix-turn-helix domain-containing protein n=1 Tax=Sinosporangium siamense TaxID=1367973 RepID=A0A919VBC0_9ACTN|nr:hypothetical protein Ssi02_74940 [Sinosporangium siamense]
MLLVLVHLRKGKTFAGLGAVFGVSAATAWRYVEETVALPGGVHDLTAARLWGIPHELFTAMHR